MTQLSVPDGVYRRLLALCERTEMSPDDLLTRIVTDAEDLQDGLDEFDVQRLNRRLRLADLIEEGGDV